MLHLRVPVAAVEEEVQLLHPALRGVVPVDGLLVLQVALPDAAWRTRRPCIGTTLHGRSREQTKTHQTVVFFNESVHKKSSLSNSHFN